MALLTRFPEHFGFESWRSWAEALTDTLSKNLGNIEQIPVGHVVLYQGAVPTGYLAANGSSFNATTYPALKNRLGGTTLPNIPAVGGFNYAIRAR